LCFGDAAGSGSRCCSGGQPPATYLAARVATFGAHVATGRLEVLCQSSFIEMNRGRSLNTKEHICRKKRKKKEMMLYRYPVAIIGAGPIGLATAAVQVGRGPAPKAGVCGG